MEEDKKYPYEEPTKTYTFWEVIEGLKLGKRFKRQNILVSIVLSQDGKTIAHCIQGRMDLNLEDFEAADWIEVTEWAIGSALGYHEFIWTENLCSPITHWMPLPLPPKDNE